MCGIYKITNLINGKSYIGQSVNIEERWKAHRNNKNEKSDRQFNTPFHRALRKYGINNFSFEVIEECDASLLNEREEYWIAYFHTYIYDKNCNGYNVTKGGNGTKGVVIKINESQVIEIQNKLKNTSLTEVEIAKEYNVSQRTISSINIGETWHNPKIIYPIRDIKLRRKIDKINNLNKCPNCGKIISYQANLCLDCLHLLQRKVIRPSREELKQLIRTTPFTTLGKMYDVSDNAVRKWCKNYILPSKSVEIKKISDEEWSKI